jgi:hypothetical protein
MGCCGKTRSPQRVENNGSAHATLAPPPVTFDYFEYAGKTGLTAIGLVTGQRYRFALPGSVVAVDSRDAPSMAGVPNLRRTKGRE